MFIHIESVEDCRQVDKIKMHNVIRNDTGIRSIHQEPDIQLGILSAVWSMVTKRKDDATGVYEK